MATPLDLEEQEQLDQLKHFWKQYGNAITWVLIVVLSAFASWNFYQYWQRGKATQASALFEEVDRSLKSRDDSKVERVFADMKNGFGNTVYAQQAGLQVAKYYYDANKSDDAKAALLWVIEKSKDEGYRSIAKLRLSGLLAEEGAYADALKLLDSSFSVGFNGLALDRKGDILSMQGQKTEAIAAYIQAYKLADDRTEYRRLIEVKLNSLGVNPVSDTPSQ
jgi:predicted negative regulator of RcsB-dependent stress response